MSSIGLRLRKERKRLGLNQTEFSDLAGVQISAQTNYETGKRHPDAAYLSIIAAAGADVLYILTGERSGAASVLAPDEAALLDNYRHSPETGREAVRKTAFAFSQSHVMGKAA